MKRLRICLLLEGTYPYITGGVSAWVHQLINGLPDIDFKLFTISPKQDQSIEYKIPANVIGHKDVVISEKIFSSKKPPGKKKLFKKLEKFHTHIKSNSSSPLKQVIELLPEEYYLYTDSFLNDRGWDMIIKENQIKNPVYPFSEYFWGWKSSHDMIFTIIATPLPDADIYHAISTGYAGLAGITAKLRYKKPFLLTEHGLYHKEREMEIMRASFIQGYQRDMWINIYNSLSRLSYHFADLIISLFEYNRRRQIELGAIKNKTRVIPNGIDINFFASVKRQKRNEFSIGLIGRVVPIKDIRTFILTAKTISEIIPNSVFYCIGPTDEDPAYYEDCRVLVRNFRIADKFHFTGKQDVRKYYSFLDVVMLTSIREAQPLVILEAFCVGIPVVATRVGNIPELLDFNERFLASPKDPEKLARSVRYIYQNPVQIRELVQKNKQKILRFYNRKQLHKEYKELYMKLAGAT